MSQVTAGQRNTCALRQSGSVACWGDPTGLGNGTDSGLYVATPVPSFPGGVADLGVGTYHSCFTLPAGAVNCMGIGSGLGNSTSAGTGTWKPVAAGTITSSTSVESGDAMSCSTNAAGTLRCWGTNSFGNLGIGSATSTTDPTVVPLPDPVASVAIGQFHACAVLTTGALWCWGSNGSGQLGIGTIGGQHNSPVAVITSGVAAVGAGYTSTCAVLTNGGVKCWGSGNSGRLGTGNETNQPSPTQVSGIGPGSGATAIGLGFNHACAVVSGAVKCWGASSSGQSGTVADDVLAPITVPGLTSGWTQLALAASTSCARSSGGTVTCWGSNEVGQLARSTTIESSATPATVLAAGAVDIDAASAGNTLCAELAAGAASCWGWAAFGQVGVDVGFTPKAVNGGTAFHATGPYWAPHASWTAYVEQQYADLLDARPSAATVNGWATQLGNGTQTPGTFITALRGDADQVNVVDPTARLYFAYFLRIPDKTGLDYWIRKKRSGTLLRSISDSFATSSEFTRRYGSLSNAGFVDLIYENLFQRNPDAAGAAYWTGKLNSRSESRGGVMAQFSESSEYKRKMASEVTVSVLNLLLLRRQVPQTEFDAAVARLDAPGGDTADLAAELLTSATYRNRFA